MTNVKCRVSNNGDHSGGWCLWNTSKLSWLNIDITPEGHIIAKSLGLSWERDSSSPSRCWFTTIAAERITNVNRTPRWMKISSLFNFCPYFSRFKYVLYMCSYDCRLQLVTMYFEWIDVRNHPVSSWTYRKCDVFRTTRRSHKRPYIYERGQ